MEGGVTVSVIITLNLWNGLLYRMLGEIIIVMLSYGTAEIHIQTASNIHRQYVPHKEAFFFIENSSVSDH